MCRLPASVCLLAVMASITVQSTTAQNCTDNCLYNTCDFWVSYDPQYTCDVLEGNYSCDCSGCNCFDSHDKCTTNCFGGDCDEYVALGYDCNELESTYGCDCTGCQCMTVDTVTTCSNSTDCPFGYFCGSLNGLVDSDEPVVGCVPCFVGESDTCESMSVSVDNCDTCTGCAVTNMSWIGDGFCDNEDGYNTAVCGWDGGDCCGSTCGVGVNASELPYECGAHGLFICQDPNATDYSCTASCLDYDCDYYTEQGYTCTDLESEFDCDCSNCRGCACEPTCSGYSCDYWNENHIGYTCESLEDDFGCNCDGCNCFVETDKCPTTCYGFNCDEWVVDAGQSCSYLESSLDCNCNGCQCEDHSSTDCTTSADCPDNHFCGEFERGNLSAIGCFPCFDVNGDNCEEQGLNRTNDCDSACSGCAVTNPSWLGDGVCDDKSGYNSLVCSWDGGDCCESTCIDGELECGTAAAYHCLNAGASDYEGDCAATCAGETCNYWTLGGYSCGALEDSFGCDCSGCASCDCASSCNGYTCDFWNQVHGIACYELENAYGCDCSSCDSCAAEVLSECDPEGCNGYSCDDWTLYHIEYDCASLESDYDCDCTGCVCYEDSNKCDTNCYGLSCDDWVDVGHSCDYVEATFGCGCGGCTCDNPTSLTDLCSSSDDCASHAYCANITVNNTIYPVCAPCYDSDGNTCEGLGVAMDNCDKCTGCAVPQEDWLGDGFCDTTLIYNTLKCNWDGGDCCESTCVDPEDTIESWTCGSDSPFSCKDPDASDYDDSCAATCFGETCDFWVTHGYGCDELEAGYGCDCSNCLDCGCGICSGYSCHYWIEYASLTCYALENDYSCDCSGCDECANQVFSECDSAGCTIGDETHSCDTWGSYHVGYDCVNLESTYSCDCTGCECSTDEIDCPSTCYGLTCDDWVNIGQDCEGLETYDECDCTGCQCVAESGTGTRVDCTVSTDCADGYYCGNYTGIEGAASYCTPCTDQDGNTCLSLGASVDSCDTCTGCSVVSASFLGDGYCDIGGGYNTDACDWDGGDCCESTCEDSVTFECGYQYACVNPSASDYVGDCRATCFGETCDYWVAAQDYSCAVLEAEYGCSCTGCAACDCNSCGGSSCAYWIHSIGYSCSELSSDHGCDCTGCYDCIEEAPCSDSCFDIPCSGWLAGGITCNDLATDYNCNCAACTGCTVPTTTVTTVTSTTATTTATTTTSPIDGGVVTQPLDTQIDNVGPLAGGITAGVVVVGAIVAIAVVVASRRGKTRSISYNHRGSHHSRRTVTGLIDSDGFEDSSSPGGYEGVSL